ncbi:MalY/PatB family protein, partial [Nonomuraea sp. LPB2021202275-12-8]|uniref:MalY/PatB family protein n=1 Tax=Nonomuraea sp. LPB2021202275-12-8 TaxID=3120159 RepID=UPI00300D7CB1
MDFTLAEPIVQALIACIERSDTGYASAHNGLHTAFAGFAARRWGWDTVDSRSSICADVSVATVELLRLLTAPGSRVVISPPVYPPFRAWIKEAGAVVAEAPLQETEQGWRLNLDTIERAFSQGAVAYLLCNPHNPVGVAHTREELENLAALADKYGVIVISDEVHAPLVLTGSVFTPFLSLGPIATRRGIVLTAASKAWNVAGLKTALILTQDPMLDALHDRLPAETPWRTGHLGVIAATTAFASGELWLDTVREALDFNRQYLADLLSRHLPRARYRQPQAGYLAWIDSSELGWGDKVAASVLEQRRVALDDGIAFGAEGAGYLRLNFACSPDILDEAITRIAQYA